jgi:glutathione S-transferase
VQLSAAAGKVFMGEEREKAIEEYLQLLKMLENELKEDFFGGETLGYVDIAAMTIPFWFTLVQEVGGVEPLTEEKFPILYKWICKLHDMDVVNECRPPKEKLLAHIRAQMEALKTAPK